MDTIARVMQLADERNLSLFKLSQLCDVSYSTLKNAEMRGSQLGVPTIERICVALGVTLSDFFAESDSFDSTDLEAASLTSCCQCSAGTSFPQAAIAPECPVVPVHLAWKGMQFLFRLFQQKKSA